MMAPKWAELAKWKELKTKFVAAAKKWQTQKRRAEVSKNRSLQAHRLWEAHVVGKDARKQEMDTALAKLTEAFPEADLTKLTPFLEDESHSSDSSST